MPDHFTAEENMQEVMSTTGQSLLCIIGVKVLKWRIEDVEVPSNESQHSSRESEDQHSEVNHEPIQERYENPSYSRFRRVASKTIVSFGQNDPENPVNWGRVCLSSVPSDV